MYVSYCSQPLLYPSLRLFVYNGLTCSDEEYLVMQFKAVHWMSADSSSLQVLVLFPYFQYHVIFELYAMFCKL